MTRKKVRMTEEGQDFLILQLSQQYSSKPMDALREYVTNAVDAISLTEEPRDGEIKISLDPKSSRIYVSDNANGLSLEELAKLPIKIGESVKRGKIDQRGEFGWGLLSFGSLGDRLHFITRQPGSSNYGYLIYEVGKGAIEYEEPITLRDRDMLDFGGPFSQGTRIILHADKDVFNQKFRSADVRSAIQEIYWPILVEEGLQFYLELIDGKVSQISQPRIRGEHILPQRTFPFEVKTRDGIVQHELRANLWLDIKTDTGKVPVYSKGVRIYRDIPELAETALSDCGLWRCKQIRGYINEPNLSVTLGRDTINKIRDSNVYNSLVEILRHIDDILWPEVEEKLAKVRKEKDSELINSTYYLLRKVYQDEDLLPIYRRRRREVVEPIEPRKIIEWGIQTPTQDKDKSKPNRDSEDADDRRRWPFDFPDWYDFDTPENHLRYKLEARVGNPTAAINSGHKDWKRVVELNPDSEEAKEYILRAQAEPLALWESQKAVEDGFVIYESPEEQIADVMRRADDIVYRAMEK